MVSAWCVPGVVPMWAGPHGNHTGVSPARHQSHAEPLPEHREWKTARAEAAVLHKRLIANVLRIRISSDGTGRFQEVPCLTHWRPMTSRFAPRSRVHEGHSTDILDTVYSPLLRNNPQHHSLVRLNRPLASAFPDLCPNSRVTVVLRNHHGIAPRWIASTASCAPPMLRMPE
jgi:hypothetical protein